METYLAYFDFTTVHGSKFIGRDGQVEFQTSATIEQIYKDIKDIEKLCVSFIHQQKPKWNILMITVKDIKMLSDKN